MRGVVLGMDYSNIKGEYLNGVYSELANLLGIEVVLKIHNTYRGQQVTFPVQLFSRDFIKKQIVDEYNGYNTKQEKKMIKIICKDDIKRIQDKAILPYINMFFDTLISTYPPNCSLERVGAIFFLETKEDFRHFDE